MKKMTVKTLLFIAIAFICSNARSMEMENYDIAVLGALNKITGKTSSLEINVGENATFGDLQIEVLSCQNSSPLDTPESASFLKIKEYNKDIFSGWMYASSPGLSAMESGIYDIWVKKCLKK